MKILLMSLTKIKYIPYANFYLNRIDCEKNDVHFLYWNRDEQEDIIPKQTLTLHEFCYPQENEVAKHKKIAGFIKYRKFAKNLIKKEKFDFIIVLPALPGVLIYRFLEKHYYKKYILDYRDLTYEKIDFYKNIMDRLIKNSAATFVSSDKFREYLVKSDNIYTSHNIDIAALSQRNNRRELPREHMPIRIAFWGFIRHVPLNIRLLKVFGNDSRFELHYYGKEQATAAIIRKYISEKDIKNVFFHGEYRPEQRYEFIKNTEIIHNLYDVENDGIRAAMGNKYYDGILFYLPQLCNKGIYMGERAEKYKTGLCVDVGSETLADDVFTYYNNMNWPEFEKACDEEADRIIEAYRAGEKVISDILG